MLATNVARLTYHDLDLFRLMGEMDGQLEDGFGTVSWGTYATVIWQAFPKRMGSYTRRLPLHPL